MKVSKGILGTLLALMVVGIGAGVATAEDYCLPIDDSQCVLLEESTEDLCCLQGGGANRLTTCIRDQYFCLDGPNAGLVWGPAYNCQAPGQPCD